MLRCHAHPSLLVPTLGTCTRGARRRGKCAARRTGSSSMALVRSMQSILSCQWATCCSTDRNDDVDDSNVDAVIARNLWKNHRILPPTSKFKQNWDLVMVPSPHCHRSAQRPSPPSPVPTPTAANLVRGPPACAMLRAVSDASRLLQLCLHSSGATLPYHFTP